VVTNLLQIGSEVDFQKVATGVSFATHCTTWTPTKRPPHTYAASSEAPFYIMKNTNIT
jgi:hypothetical protein